MGGLQNVFMSFRHTFANALKQAEANTLHIAQLMGHADASLATGRYGKDYPLEILYQTICLLDFMKKGKVND